MNKTFGADSIEKAIDDLKQGKMIILLDDEDRENEGDLIIAAEFADAQAVNFMATHGRGLICLTLEEEAFDRLGLPMMTTHNRSPMQTAFGAGFEAAEGVTTGISAFDRARSIAVAVDPASGPEDITIPGHVFPLRARAGGVFTRAGHTEGATDLARLAGLKPSAVLCEIMADDGHMARLPAIRKFAEKYALTITTNKALIDYRLQREITCEPGAISRLPVADAPDLLVQTFYCNRDKQDHLALYTADLDRSQPTLVRVHSECLTGDVLGSLRCDCGAQLQLAKSQLAKSGGILIYLRQEGRGIGLAEKIKAYALQDEGLDTLEANKRLGHKIDLRDYGIAAHILKSLEIKSIRLMTNNPHKVDRLTTLGIDVVERVSLETQPTENNRAYLKAKEDKLGHFLK